MQYSQAAKHHDFSSSRISVELGSGGGKQAEIMHLAHPELCLVLFDLPPQLYVAHQFLSATFPGDVVPYATARDAPDLSTLVAPGRIVFAGAWRFPDILNIQPDLFWNAASFQEMEPPIVANYLDLVNRSAGAVYLHEKMEGQAVARRPGMFGVLQQTTLEDYRRALPAFTLASISPTLLPTARTRPLHSDSYWRRSTSRSSDV
jgi:hypothetical protein